MNVSVDFKNSQHTIALDGAILLYRSTTSGERSITAATVHDVKHGVIEPGRAVDRHDLQRLTGDLAKRQAREVQSVTFLPPQVVAYTKNVLAWWMPARVDRIWFHPHGDDKDETATLKAISGEKVYHPPLLFVVRADEHERVGVRLFALASSERPEPHTPLYLAPYWNISNNGSLCVGGARMPKHATPANIPKFEKAFFESNFTHNNYQGSSTKFTGGHTALWKAMLAAPFKVQSSEQIAKLHAKHLVSAKLCASQAIERAN